MATQGISQDRITIPRWTIQPGPRVSACRYCGGAVVLVKADNRHVLFCACQIIVDAWMPRKHTSP
jgi:hypothetical protein